MFQDWPRCIVCIDMNAFFASIEQLLQPKLRNQPIAITNGHHGSCIITSSYPARAYGVRTGMRFSYARLLCPDLIQVSARSSVYEKYSKALMKLLYEEFSPDIEVFSVDEAFLDMSNVYHGYSSPRQLAQAICDCVQRQLSLPCSVGISGDKTTAKYAAKLHKPSGVTVIEPLISQQILAPVPVQELCGIGPNTAKYLARYGALTCATVCQIPVSILSKKFGIKGQRLWLMCSGKDPDMVRPYLQPAKSMGHSKMLPPGILSRSRLSSYLDTMAFKLSYRMLLQQQFSHKYICKVWLSGACYVNELVLPQATCDYRVLAQWVSSISQQLEIHSMIKKVQITALNLSSLIQNDLLDSSSDIANLPVMHKALCEIYKKFGQSSLFPARLAKVLPRVQSTNVISPAWKGSVPKPLSGHIWY